MKITSPIPRLLLVALLLAATSAALVPAAAQAGPKRQVGSGVAGAFPWRVTAERRSLAGMSALCLAIDHSWNADGSSFGTIAGNCVVGRVNGRFSLRAGRCNGVFAVLGRASAGDRTLRKLAFAVDRRARSLRVVFPGGERRTLKTHRAPRALRFPVRFAWLVDTGSAFPARIVARNGRATVGGWRKGGGC